MLSTQAFKLAALVLVTLPAPCVPTAEPDARLTVAPGAVIRWFGADTESCSLAGDEYPAIDDTCWYPIDVLTSAGPLVLARNRGGITERTTVDVGPYAYPEQKLTVEPEMVHPPDAQLDRIRNEARRVAELWHRPGPSRFTLPLCPPLQPLPAGRNFGSRRVFNGEPRSPHTGVDYTSPTGAPVFAVANGLVVLAGDHYFAGNSVYIDHGEELVSMYFHLSEISVSEGDTVLSGAEIGAVGATGRVTGSHLHFGVRWHGARVDPRILLGPPSAIATIGD